MHIITHAHTHIHTPSAQLELLYVFVYALNLQGFALCVLSVHVRE